MEAIMEKKELLYEGKAKKVYTTENPDVLIVDYKDDATAFNGVKKGTIVGKGVVNNRMTNHIFKMLEENQYKIQYRVMLARYRGKTLCPKCHGTRLKPEAGYVRVGGKNISELVDLPITELKQFFDHLELDEHDSNVS